MNAGGAALLHWGIDIGGLMHGILWVGGGREVGSGRGMARVFGVGAAVCIAVFCEKG